ncbi:MAG: hypothetical protein OJF49_000900 [Ktedonobacterales bacterium]|jgi:hypothetical protein|nr:MAG: hypothetical protein OJF49_000900 [Ktedonobacterales bacterium]
MNGMSAHQEASVHVDSPSADEQRVRGNLLFIARACWIALALLILVLDALMLPGFAAQLGATCQPGPSCFGIQMTSYDLHLLHKLGISRDFLIAYQVAMAVITVIVYYVVGTLIFWRKSSDRMALFCAFIVVIFGGVVNPDILQDTLSLTSPTWSTFIGLLDVLGQAGFVTFFLLFPSGRFVPRWTRWCSLAVLIFWVYTVFITQNQSNNSAPALANVFFFAVLLVAVGTQIYRYRKVSTFKERQQTKWVVFGFSIGILGFALLVNLGNLFLPSEVLQSGVLTTLIAGTSINGFLMLIPISIAIAILRSQLYDIDVIINRALVYGPLTAILAAVYAGLVIGLQHVVGLITGETSQPVVIVISTLVIAALFQPLRRRLQNTIDRRFYRSKYNAANTLEVFSGTLRQAVDLDEICEQMVAVVRETLQPTQVSLWLSASTQHATETQERAES